MILAPKEGLRTVDETQKQGMLLAVDYNQRCALRVAVKLKDINLIQSNISINTLLDRESRLYNLK